ncbi:probable pectinesterase 66 [Eucalyptus grandis]|uniref:probable pectinesterase 66 n=1 Tax=Eucalyptus grandis TaxID=71139 RepID=UPI00192EAC10|nr:probable pectinesterase 66 [Eucalyptus grandis]
MDKKMQLLITAPLAATLFCIFLTTSRAADCTAGNEGDAITVDLNGRGHFTSVQKAIDSVPSGNSKWITIRVNPGTYKYRLPPSLELVTIPLEKPCIFLQGKGRHLTTIAFDSHQQTDTSATFTSNPDNIVVQGITFKNSFNRYWKQTDPPIVQALAARVYGDKCVFLQCGFLGVQDTVWDVQGRHLYDSCYIEGAVDFIFGGGQSFFQDCNMNVTVSLPPYNLRDGIVTAQGREEPHERSGFFFERGAVFGVGKFLLGRAYRRYSTVVFHKTKLAAGVAPEGWDAWTYKGHEDSIAYAEVDCEGRGSDTSKRVPWERHLTPEQMRYFSRRNFIDQEGWLSKTPVAKMLKP